MKLVYIFAAFVSLLTVYGWDEDWQDEDWEDDDDNDDDDDDECELEPMEDFNPVSILGTWYEIKLYEPGLNPAWFWKDYTKTYTQLSNGDLKWELRGRTQNDEGCFHYIRYLNKTQTPGKYSYIKNSVVKNIVFLHSDYNTFLIMGDRIGQETAHFAVFGRESELDHTAAETVDELLEANPCLDDDDLDQFVPNSHLRPCPE